MLKKFTNKKGFTLMEMLIVVAIIAILVAIAIPTFTSAMEKAKSATDLANIRSGYANAMIIAITEEPATETTYLLQKDGTVKTGATAADNAYVCTGSSDKAGDSLVGGKFAPTSIGWNATKKYIKYTVKQEDGVYRVTDIKGADSAT